MNKLNTPNLNLELIKPNYAQKEILINESLITIDLILGKKVLSRNLNSPPENPNEYDLYIIGENACAEWLNHDNEIAYYISGWKFIKPFNNMQMFIEDEDLIYKYSEDCWNESKINSDKIDSLGINCKSDDKNKLSVKTDGILIDGLTDGPRIYINKNSSSANATFIYQHNYVGKAEFGLTSDDNFSLKVSNDGNEFRESFTVDHKNANFIFKANAVGIDQAISKQVENMYQIDLLAANIFELEFINNIEIKFPKIIVKTGAVFTLILKNEFKQKVNWPDNITWMNKYTTSELSALKFITCNQGKNWYGFNL